MKNANDAQRRALRERASRLRLPPLERGPDGHLAPQSLALVRERALRIARENRIVGLSLVLCAPGGATDTVTLGHARLRPRTPVTERTCFRVASVSKLVMSFGALSLTESGLLSLDADVGTLLGYPVRSPHAPDVPVTLRMLLTHTAGIRDEGSYGTRGMAPGCTLCELLGDPQNWLPLRPGEAFHYSNLGAGAAGSVMERAANAPFDDIMRSRVFAPLSIHASYDPRRIAPASDLADGYAVRGLLPPVRRYDAAALAARPPEPFDPERDYLCAAGRLITDSAGMATLVRLLVSQDGMGGVGACGRGLNVAFLPDVFPGVSAVGHQGVAYGMCAELFGDPERGAGVGVMTSGTRLVRTPPLMRAGFDLLALGFAALAND